MRQSDRASAVTGSVPPTGARAAGPPSGATPRVRTQRLAVLERRAARARRRFLVTLGLVLVTAGAWAAVGLGYLVWWGAMVPTALLAAVLLLGRFAVLAARRSDARWRAERRAEQQRATQERTLAHGGPYAPRNRARITGRAVHPSDTSTGMIPRVRPATAGQAEPAERGATHREAETSVPAGDTRTGDADDTEPVREAPGDPRPSTEPWEPVPVPLPTYVTKPAAPRREQATTVPTHETRAAPPGAVPTAEAPSTGERPGPDERHEGGRELEEPRPRTETLGLPLEQILARRRAAG